MSWVASTDNNAVTRYDIYVNGKKTYSTTSTSFTVNELDSLIPYTFIVKAVDEAENNSPASNQRTYIPEGAPHGVIPGPPSALVATATSYNKIKLNWNDTTTNETGFEIVRSTSVNGTYVPVMTVAANTVTYTDSGLTASKNIFTG